MRRYGTALCAVCGREFAKATGNQLTCSRECGRELERARHHEYWKRYYKKYRYVLNEAKRAKYAEGRQTWTS